MVAASGAISTSPGRRRRGRPPRPRRAAASAARMPRVPTTAGIPYARARIAACAVGDPASSTMPRMCSRGSVAVSDGERSSATTTAGAGSSDLLHREPGEQTRDPVRDVDHVRAAGGEDRVVERGELVGNRGTRRLDRRDPVLAGPGDPRGSGIDERGVPGHGRVGHEDRRLVLVTGGTHALREGHEVVSGLVRGGAQPRDLRIRLARRHPAADRELPAADVDPCAPGHAGRRRHAREPPRLGHRHRWNPPFGRPGTRMAAAPIVGHHRRRRADLRRGGRTARSTGGARRS